MLRRLIVQRRGRAALVFALALAVLGVCAGKSLSRPSPDNHYVYLAQGWLEGRLSLEGKPPSYNDWALVRTLELRDGRTLRAYPCETAACRDARRTERVDTWWILGEGWVRIPMGSVRKATDTWYVSFPPAPAVVMLPFVAVWDLKVWDVLLTCIAAALIPALLLWHFDGERTEPEQRRQHLWAAAAWAIASPACFVGANGRVWFTAQIFGALFLTLYIIAAWRARAPARAGLWFALAICCRPTMALALPFFALEWWRDGKRWRSVGAFVVPVAAIGALVAAHNYARFEDIFEFGHRFLKIRWQPRMQEIGMFDSAYLWRNVQCLLSLMPQLSSISPYVRVSLHGTALWLTTPWLVTLVAARTPFVQRTGLLVSALAVATPLLLYQNSGQIQFTYRFALDWLPLVLMILVFGGGAAKRWFAPLVLVAALANLYGAYQFAHAPSRLFVKAPLGWPFEAELEQMRNL